ncbi:hypothetical protein ACFU6K_35220 [Kitasatospora sp. NPDC057512]|uniref:hypothetical protein n=1 Tax=Kitasatospora sp. NPDC057512 TaxID=3346154 RepID=UPI00368467C3
MAFKNQVDSLTGRHTSRAVRYPRIKEKGKAWDSFRLRHDVSKPTIRPDGHRRLITPRLGSVRIHDSAKRLPRLFTKGYAVVQSVTISRGDNRWYASCVNATAPCSTMGLAGYTSSDILYAPSLNTTTKGAIPDNRSKSAAAHLTPFASAEPEGVPI